MNSKELDIIEQQQVTEEWRPVVGYEGYYEVSSLGRVRSVERLIIGSDGRRRVFPSKLRSLLEYKQYVYVNLFLGSGKQRQEKRHLVHRLVAEAFLPNPLNRDCVDHLNTIRNDNRACNLAWVSHAENQKNPITAQRLKWRIRPVVRLAPDGSIKEYPQTNDVKNDGFSCSAICKCCKNGGGYHKGYMWAYKGEPLKDFEAYQKEKQNNERLGYIKRHKPLIAYKGEEELYFEQQIEAEKRGFFSTCIYKSMRTGRPYKGYNWRHA